MSYFAFSEGFKKYSKLRDERLIGLVQCEFVLSPEELQEKGFVLLQSEYYDEGEDSYEFHEYAKGSYRAVYIESYIEKEGGMYIQNLYATAEAKKFLNPA